MEEHLWSINTKHFRVTWKFIGSTRLFWKILTQETRGTKFCRLQFKESMEYLCLYNIKSLPIFAEYAVKSRSRKLNNKVVLRWPICPPRSAKRSAGDEIVQKAALIMVFEILLNQYLTLCREGDMAFRPIKIQKTSAKNWRFNTHSWSNIFTRIHILIQYPYQYLQIFFI